MVYQRGGRFFAESLEGPAEEAQLALVSSAEATGGEVQRDTHARAEGQGVVLRLGEATCGFGA